MHSFTLILSFGVVYRFLSAVFSALRNEIYLSPLHGGRVCVNVHSLGGTLSSSKHIASQNFRAISMPDPNAPSTKERLVPPASAWAIKAEEAPTAIPPRTSVG